MKYILLMWAVWLAGKYIVHPQSLRYGHKSLRIYAKKPRPRKGLI